jgi:site-specific recombinase XerD
MENVVIKEAFNDFILSCRADGLRPATVRWYESILTPLINHFDDVTLIDITTKALRLYVVSLQERDTRYEDEKQKPAQHGGLSDESIASHVTAIHRFFNWCVEEYALTFNPMQHIRRPRRPQKHPKAIDMKDLVKLFNSTGDNEAGARDRALLAFLADTGARLGGVITLTKDRLHLDDHKAYVSEKGQKSRMVVFTPLTRALLDQWLGVKPSGDYIFCHVKTGEGLTQSGINEILKRLKKRAGVSGRVNPHSFRHNFARQYIMNGGDVLMLSKLMGHSDPKTTMEYYAVFTPDELAEMHEKLSPLNNLNGDTYE